MEVRANLAVYKGHMLPGQQHTVPAGLGLARLPASHASPFPACTALNSFPTIHPTPACPAILQYGTWPLAPTSAPFTLPAVELIAPPASGAPTARSRCACS
jgi:hypothetical protein